MLVECNAVLLVGNYVAKIPQFSKYFFHGFHKKIFARFPKSALTKLNTKVQ